MVNARSGRHPHIRPQLSYKFPRTSVASTQRLAASDRSADGITEVPAWSALEARTRTRPSARQVRRQGLGMGASIRRPMTALTELPHRRRVQYTWRARCEGCFAATVRSRPSDSPWRHARSSPRRDPDTSIDRPAREPPEFRCVPPRGHRPSRRRAAASGRSTHRVNEGEETRLAQGPSRPRERSSAGLPVVRRCPGAS